MIQLPLPQSSVLEQPPALEALQEAGTVHRVRTAVGDPAWLVTGYATVRRLFSDERLGRSHPEPETAARTGKSALFGGPLGAFATEHADHERMRELLQPHFTPKRMRELQPRVEELTRGLLDDLERRPQPADLQQALAVPLPILVICELLGVPYEDRDQFRAWSEAAADTANSDRSWHGLGELFGYGQRLVEQKRRNPADDVISRLAGTDGVSTDEAAQLSMALLFAGHETTVAQIGLAVLLLLASPDQWQAVVDDPARVPRAVEETLRAGRYGGRGIPRYARTDLVIDGTAIRAGELVLLDTGAANHDAAAFPEPGRLELTRRDAQHVTFGHGLRFCIGAPLARVELNVALRQLAGRFPTLRLAAPVADLRTHTDTLVGGLRELPVAW